VPLDRDSTPRHYNEIRESREGRDVMPRRVATSSEVAHALGLSAATIQGYARSGRVPADVTPGGHYRYDLAEVELALYPDASELVGELTRPRPTGLGRGVEASRSPHAALQAALRSARPEQREGRAVPTGTPAALEALVTHARRVTVTSVSA